MDIEKTDIETIATIPGYTLTVTRDEMKCIIAALAMANFDEVDRYTTKHFGVTIHKSQDIVYRLFNDTDRAYHQDNRR